MEVQGIDVVGIREWPFDIYGGGGQKKWQKKKFAADILPNKSLFMTNNLQQIVLNVMNFEKESLLLQNAGKVCFAGNLPPPSPTP